MRSLLFVRISFQIRLLFQMPAVSLKMYLSGKRSCENYRKIFHKFLILKRTEWSRFLRVGLSNIAVPETGLAGGDIGWAMSVCMKSRRWSWSITAERQEKRFHYLPTKS